MTRSIVSDADLRSALRAAPPIVAPVDLRDRILDSAGVTPQVGRLPWPLAPLADANPVARRRALLVAAALLMAAGLVAAAAVGALLERQRQRSIDPPSNLVAYVDAAYRRLGDLPAFQMVALESGDLHRIYSDGAGMIRDERPSAGTTRIVSRDRAVTLGVNENGVAVAVDEGRSSTAPGSEIGALIGQMQTCDPAPRYFGTDLVAGRGAHRIGCGPFEYAFDVDTGLVLRSAAAAESSAEPNAAGGPSAAALASWIVTELDIGPQPAELFSFDPPGYRHEPANYGACAPDAMDAMGGCNSPVPTPTPAPLVHPSAAPGVARLADPDAVLAAAALAYGRAPAMAVVTRESQYLPGDSTFFRPSLESRAFSDGAGRFRLGLGDEAGTIYITTDGHNWISYVEDGRTVWRDDWGYYADHGGVGDVKPEFEQGCPAGWRWIGVDLVLGRSTDHLGCDLEDLWVDQASGLVLRYEVRPADPLQRLTSIWEVVALDFGAQPPELFQLPPGAVVIPRPTPAPS